MLILLGAYTATALKLYAQGRAMQQKKTKIVPKQSQHDASANRATSQADSTAPLQTPPKQQRAMHIQALKIYTSVFLLFFVSYFSLVIWRAFDIKWMIYFYYINHTLNPVIYYCFVEKFRTSVKEYWARLTAR